MSDSRCDICDGRNELVSVSAVISAMGGRRDRVRVSIPGLRLCLSCVSRSRVVVSEALMLRVETAIATAISPRAAACLHASGASVSLAAGDSVKGSAAPLPSA